MPGKVADQLLPAGPQLEGGPAGRTRSDAVARARTGVREASPRLPASSTRPSAPIARCPGSAPAPSGSSAGYRGDLLARHGGDEFVLVMPHSTLDVARGVVARLPAASTPVVGATEVAQWQPGMTPDALVAAADRDLYAHK